MEPSRDPRQWAVIAEPSGTLFAERPTEKLARDVADEYAPLLRDLGKPRIEPPLVVDLDSERRVRAAFRELERAGFVLHDG